MVASCSDCLIYQSELEKLQTLFAQWYATLAVRLVENRSQPSSGGDNLFVSQSVFNNNDSQHAEQLQQQVKSSATSAEKLNAFAVLSAVTGVDLSLGSVGGNYGQMVTPEQNVSHGGEYARDSTNHDTGNAAQQYESLQHQESDPANNAPKRFKIELPDSHDTTTFQSPSPHASTNVEACYQQQLDANEASNATGSASKKSSVSINSSLRKSKRKPMATSRIRNYSGTPESVPAPPSCRSDGMETFSSGLAGVAREIFDNMDTTFSEEHETLQNPGTPAITSCAGAAAASLGIGNNELTLNIPENETDPGGFPGYSLSDVENSGESCNSAPLDDFKNGHASTHTMGISTGVEPMDYNAIGYSFADLGDITTGMSTDPSPKLTATSRRKKPENDLEAAKQKLAEKAGNFRAQIPSYNYGSMGVPSEEIQRFLVLRDDSRVECAICGKVYSYFSSACRHVGLHISGCRFNCLFCSESYAEVGDLTCHVRALHGMKLSNKSDLMARHPPAPMQAEANKHILNDLKGVAVAGQQALAPTASGSSATPPVAQQLGEQIDVSTFNGSYNQVVNSGMDAVAASTVIVGSVLGMERSDQTGNTNYDGTSKALGSSSGLSYAEPPRGTVNLNTCNLKEEPQSKDASGVGDTARVVPEQTMASAVMSSPPSQPIGYAVANALSPVSSAAGSFSLPVISVSPKTSLSNVTVYPSTTNSNGVASAPGPIISSSSSFLTPAPGESLREPAPTPPNTTVHANINNTPAVTLTKDETIASVVDALAKGESPTPGRSISAILPPPTTNHTAACGDHIYATRTVTTTKSASSSRSPYSASITEQVDDAVESVLLQNRALQSPPTTLAAVAQPTIIPNYQVTADLTQSSSSSLSLNSANLATVLANAAPSLHAAPSADGSTAFAEPYISTVSLHSKGITTRLSSAKPKIEQGPG